MKKGFTLLEVILVVAISTLLFMSVTIGIGSRIATGRYKTASTEIVDYLRDVYTIALNTENAREGIEGARTYCTLYGAWKEGQDEITGKPLFTNTKKDANSTDITVTDVEPGRTNCAIYGKAIYFGAEDGKVHVFDVVGDTVTNNKKETGAAGVYTTELKELEGKTVLEQLEAVRADIFAAIPSNVSDIKDINFSSNCLISPAGSESTYEPNWGALFKTANFGDSASGGSTSRENTNDFIGMVMIVRSPASGNVSTFFYERPDGDGNWEFLDSNFDRNYGCGTYKDGSPEKTFIEENSPVELIKDQNERRDDSTMSDTVPEYNGFCIGSDDFYIAISGQKKFVEFIPGGQNASAIKLVETNGKDPDIKESYNPCLR